MCSDVRVGCSAVRWARGGRCANGDRNGDVVGLPVVCRLKLRVGLADVVDRVWTGGVGMDVCHAIASLPSFLGCGFCGFK